MADFPKIDPARFLQRPRQYSRDLIPTSVKQPTMATDIIAHSSTLLAGPYTVPDGQGLIITIVSTATADPSIPLLGKLGITFFHTALVLANYISPGDTGWTFHGPVPQANVVPRTKADGTVIASDGHNEVYKMGLTNNTGASKDIYYFYDTRVIMGVGGPNQ